ncbi:MAG TPA: hypothetical protein VGH11_06745 [Jatrophihabitans sp.]
MVQPAGPDGAELVDGGGVVGAVLELAGVLVGAALDDAELDVSLTVILTLPDGRDGAGAFVQATPPAVTATSAASSGRPR